MQSFLSTPTPPALRTRSPNRPYPAAIPRATVASPCANSADLTPPTPPRLPPPPLPVASSTVRRSRDDGSDLTEEIRRSLENLDAIIQLHDDGGLTEQEMLNLPAPAPELLEFGEGSPQHCPYIVQDATEPARKPPPPAPPRRSSIKQGTGELTTVDNGHAMTEEAEDAGIDQSSRSVADILQKFSRATTPPKVPTVPPALRSKSIPGVREQPLDVVPPPPAAFRSADASPQVEPVDPSPPQRPDPAPAEPEPKPKTQEEEADSEDFGFARLRKLAELSSVTGEDVHKKGVLRRAKTVDVTSSMSPPEPTPPPPKPQPQPAVTEERRSSEQPDESDESFAFSRLRALAEQKAATSGPGGKDSSESENEDNNLEIDLSQVPGYTRIDSRLPNWKRSMVEKKNKEAIEAYLIAKEEEERERKKWANVPAWKRNLVQKKQQDKKEPETSNKAGKDDSKLPGWKRNMVQRRKTVDET